MRPEADTARETGRARFSEDFTHVIDSDGVRVKISDPRVVHVWTATTSPNTTRLVSSFFRRRGWNFRISGRSDAEAQRYARELCSGRECLPATSMAGAAYMDVLRNRGKDEISVYYNLDQDGPCQNGAWPVVWGTFARRIRARNAIFMASLGTKTNYMGMGKTFATELASAVSLGDLLDEAQNTLRCLAADPSSAQAAFEGETDRVIKNAERGKGAMKRAAKEWARAMASVPLRSSVRSTPRVLIFGGLNVIFVHEPIVQFFLERGIIPKVVDFGEGVTWITSEDLMRYGVSRGRFTPRRIWAIPSLLLSILNPANGSRAARAALGTRLQLSVLDFYARRYRRILARSGLLFDVHTSFFDILTEGNAITSLAGFTETPVTVGRFLCSVKSGVFDGAVNLGCFNCQPAMNSQALLRPLANDYDIAYAAIDCEGPWISANQRRLLDAVAVQARRIRERKNPR